MKTATLIIFLSVTSILLSAADKKTRIGVIDFEAKGTSALEASVAADLFRGELVRAGIFDVLDRNNMNTILKEQEYQQSGCTESACAVKIGKILNMQNMIYGAYMKVGSVSYLACDMINVETSKIERSARIKVEGSEKIEAAVQALVVELTGIKQEKRTSSYVTKGFGALSITSSPPGAKVYIDGEEKGETRFFKEVKDGVHKIRIYKDGYLPKMFEERIEDGQTKEINIALQEGISADEYKIRMDSAGAGISRNIWLAGSFGACALAAFTSGFIFHQIGIAQYADYRNASTITAAKTQGDAFSASYDIANILYWSSIGSAAVAVGFGIWLFIDIISYASNKDLYEKALKNVSLDYTPDSIRLSYALHF